VISSSQRPLPENTQQSQQTNIHAPGEIRTHDLNRRAAADLRLRPRGHWNRHIYRIVFLLFLKSLRKFIEDTLKIPRHTICVYKYKSNSNFSKNSRCKCYRSNSFSHRNFHQSGEKSRINPHHFTYKQRKNQVRQFQGMVAQMTGLCLPVQRVCGTFHFVKSPVISVV